MRRRLRRSIPLLLLGAGLLASCGGHDPTSGADADARLTSPPAAAAELQRTVDAAARGVLEEARGELPGIWVGVWSPTRGTHIAAYGDAVAGGRRATVGDHVRIGSISKTFVATVVLQLVDEGRMGLDEPVASYLPRLARRLRPIGSATVRHLLTMTSGLPDVDGDPLSVTARVPDDPLRVWSVEEVIETTLSAGEIRPAGTPGYSTINYLILQRIAEAVTGSPLHQLVAERLTGPLDLDRTALPPPGGDRLPEPASHGYLLDDDLVSLASPASRAHPGVDVTGWSASWAQGAGAMWSTVEDLGRWAAAGSGNALLPRSLVAERLRNGPVPEMGAYGMGLQISGPWIGHAGATFGWETIAIHDRESGATFVAAVNASGATPQNALLTILQRTFPSDAGRRDRLRVALPGR